MIIGYYLAFIAALIIFGPFLLCWKKARAGLWQKLGFVPAQFKVAGQARVWFHSVSVGEFNALFPLLLEFHKRYPDYALFVSTTTLTGQEIASSKAGSFASIFYFPFDLPWATKAWLSTINPDLVVIVETEIWPGFLHECQKHHIPVVLVNGRLSPKSFQGYKRFGWFFSPVVSNFAALVVQSESEAHRFQSLAGKDTPTFICGNIKFDGIKSISHQEKSKLQNQLQLSADDFVIVAGSTHEGEELVFLQALESLAFSFKLILAPRHPERFEQVAQLIKAHNLLPRRFSLQEHFQTNKDVYLLDTLGQLGNFYSMASLAFVGGTLVPSGGHNLVEPYIYKIPVLCGPHVYKTKDVADKLQERRALIMVKDSQDLTTTIAQLFTNKEKRLETGKAGWQWLQENQGAVTNTLDVIESILSTKKTSKLVAATKQ